MARTLLGGWVAGWGCHVVAAVVVMVGGGGGLGGRVAICLQWVGGQAGGCSQKKVSIVSPAGHDFGHGPWCEASRWRWRRFDVLSARCFGALPPWPKLVPSGARERAIWRSETKHSCSCHPTIQCKVTNESVPRRKRPDRSTAFQFIS